MATDNQDSFLPIDPNDNSEDAQWVRQLIELEAQTGTLVGKVQRDEATEDVMDNVQRIEQEADWNFCDWFLLDRQQIRTSHQGGSPDYPGIYDIGLSLPIPRLNGQSKIFYIGRGAGQTSGDRGTVSASLHRHISNGGGPEKWMRALRPDDHLFARFAIARSVEEARYWEKLRIRWFIEQHWELPVCNTSGVASHPMDEAKLTKTMEDWKDWAYRRN